MQDIKRVLREEDPAPILRLYDRGQLSKETFDTSMSRFSLKELKKASLNHESVLYHLMGNQDPDIQAWCLSFMEDTWKEICNILMNSDHFVDLPEEVLHKNNMHRSSHGYEYFLDSLRKLYRTGNLKYFNEYSFYIDSPDEMRYFRESHGIQKLHLYFGRLNSEMGWSFPQSTFKSVFFRNIRQRDFSEFCRNSETPSLRVSSPHIRDLSGLENLKVQHLGFWDADINWDTLPELEEVKFLHLSGCSIYDLEYFLKFPNLFALDVSGSQVGKNFKILDKLTSLRILSVSKEDLEEASWLRYNGVRVSVR